MEEGKRTKVRHEPTMCAQEEEATIPPGWLFEQLKQYLITRDECLVHSLVCGIRQASTDIIADLLMMFDMEELCVPEAHSLQILAELIARTEDQESVDISLEWLIQRSSMCEYDMEMNEAITHVLTILLTYSCPEDYYFVAVDYSYEVMAGMDEHPTNMGELLYMLCLFVEYACEEEKADLSVCVTTYLLARSNWVLLDWKLLNLAIKIGIGYVESSEIQARLRPEMECSCMCQVMDIFDAFGALQSLEIDFSSLPFGAKMRYRRFVPPREDEEEDEEEENDDKTTQ